ncbi:Uncharacterized protein TCM_018760 [Theobroma cacao]|uniref:Uncharacterized protein n=1 Tax=Theobroma cacao TaxID=3641 RepID=A0A061EFD1_THECC|nr:Uncharacterized protein TCM_018760 [Theobroma cacao]
MKTVERRSEKGEKCKEEERILESNHGEKRVKIREESSKGTRRNLTKRRQIRDGVREQLDYKVNFEYELGEMICQKVKI